MRNWDIVSHLAIRLAALGCSTIIFASSFPADAQDADDSGNPVLESYDLPNPGASWSFLFTDRHGIEYEQDWKRLADEQIRGKQVNRYRVASTTRIFDAETRAWMVTLDRDGQTLYSAEPNLELLQLPLYAGKTWVARYAWTDHASGRSWDVVDHYEVKGQETITVPAGTFESWRYESHPVGNGEVSHTVWLVPELGITVKAESVFSEQHYKGPGKSRRELIWYSKVEHSGQ